MSSNSKVSVKKLIPSFLVKNPIETNGNTWSDNRSSSLPNLTSKAMPDNPENGNLASDNAIDRTTTTTRKQSSILRNFKLKSLTKRHNLNSLTRPVKNEDRTCGKGPVRVLAHENKYDKYPGSDPSREITDGLGLDGDSQSSTDQNAAPVIDTSKHHFFTNLERIGYVKKSPHKSKTSSQEGSPSVRASDSTDITAGPTALSGIEGNDSRENHSYSTSFDFASEFHDGKPELEGRDVGSPTVPTLDSSEAKILKDRPPARPPKPLKLRGEPLVKSTDRPAKNEQEQPPRPPAREPTAHTNFPTIRAVRLLHGNRESGAYESINEPPPVQPEFGLPGELRKLPHQPWYWGPLTQQEAEEKLRGLPDGYFLVRDSSDERYLLSLSFNSNRRPVHTRFEYVGGQFSINDSQGYLSVVDLIEDAVRESQNGVYSFMQNVNGTQTFPARLTNPVSRFTEMKTLQHLCRFVIRETFPRHYIADLPVPEKIKKYILENQY